MGLNRAKVALKYRNSSSAARTLFSLNRAKVALK